MMDFKEWLLNEAKADIIGLGFPEIIAKILHERFGNLAYLIAKWFRDYKYQPDPKPDNWWLQTTSSLRGTSLYDLTDLYKSTTDEDSYKKALYRKGISDENFLDLDYEKQELKKQIENQFLNDYFFKDEFINQVIAGQIKDINNYKKLNFKSARDKFDKKSIFQEREPLKTYSNGYKWIDVGQRCQLVGGLMKNCGSAGLMSMDEDRTLLVLFDDKNKPHIIVTYSPNEKRIAQDQGIGSTEPKEKYHDYILDLANFLNVRYDVEKSKSPKLIAKYLISKATNDFQEIPIKDDWSAYFKFKLNGKDYITNSREFISLDDIHKVEQAIQSKKIELKNNYGNLIQRTFNHQNRDILMNLGINFQRLSSLENVE